MFLVVILLFFNEFIEIHNFNVIRLCNITDDSNHMLESITVLYQSELHITTWIQIIYNLVKMSKLLNLIKLSLAFS